MKKLIIGCMFAISFFFAVSAQAQFLPDLSIINSSPTIDYSESLQKIDIIVCNIGKVDYFGNIQILVTLSYGSTGNYPSRAKYNLRFDRTDAITFGNCKDYSLPEEELTKEFNKNYSGVLLKKGLVGEVYITSSGAESSIENNRAGAITSFVLSNRDKFYGLTKDIYVNLAFRGFITKAEKEQHIQSALQNIYTEGNDPEVWYDYNVMQKQVITDAVLQRNRYYRLVSNLYLDLYKKNLVTKVEQQNITNIAYYRFFTIKTNPKDLYEEALFFHKNKSNGNTSSVISNEVCNNNCYTNMAGENTVYSGVELQKDTYYRKISAIYDDLKMDNYISKELYNNKMKDVKYNIYINQINPVTEYTKAVLFASQFRK